jgi:hypothetical protein
MSRLLCSRLVGRRATATRFVSYPYWLGGALFKKFNSRPIVWIRGYTPTRNCFIYRLYTADLRNSLIYRFFTFFTFCKSFI